ncbi:hypothetical protein BD413DRAFT_613164 [Trametes elegans]|nr:hypothetical protein BD413DRAFT_613164 [Trametes elegans]
MSTIEKTITIKAGTLGSPCSLTLGFVPKDAAIWDTVTPIAWKVITLKDNGTFTWTWNNVFGGIHAVIDPDTGVVEADEYTPIAIGQTSDMLLDRTKRPPQYTFSAPTTFQGQGARIMNRTGGLADIGAGWITNLDKPGEAIDLALVSRRVNDASPAYANFQPLLYLWASLDYEESELLDSSVTDVKPLWSGDLSKITGKQITITVKRENGTLVADGPSAGAPSKAIEFALSPKTYTYTAELAFSEPALVSEGLNAIVKGLASQGYFPAKVTQKGYDTEAHLQLTLPESVSCNRAEKDLTAAIEKQPFLIGKAFIKAHSGFRFISASQEIEKWAEVNPASAQWFDVTEAVAVEGNSAFLAEADAAAYAQKSGDAGTNGAGKGANGSADAGVVRRKGSKALLSVFDQEASAPAEDKYASVGRRRGAGRRAAAQ